MVAGRSSFDLCWPIGYKWFPDPTFIQVTLCSPVRAAAFEKIYIFLPAAPFNMRAIIAGKYDECLFIPSLFLPLRSVEHTSALQSLMRISYAVLCLTK